MGLFERRVEKALTSQAKTSERDERARFLIQWAMGWFVLAVGVAVFVWSLAAGSLERAADTSPLLLIGALLLSTSQLAVLQGALHRKMAA